MIRVWLRWKHVLPFEHCLPFPFAAVLDADTVDLIAAKYAQQIEKQILVRRSD